MLELRKWLIRTRNPHYEFKWPHFEVVDPETGREVGTIRANTAARVGSVRSGSWNLIFEARSLPDEALVFSCCWKFRLWRPPLLVWDAAGELIGTFKRKWFSLNGGFWIFDGRRQPLGEVRADWTQYEFRVLDSRGGELGRVSRKLVGLSRAVLYNERDHLVTAGEGEAITDDTKRLLLAARFAAAAIR